MPSGGSRIGSGRPKKEQSQRMIEQINKFVDEDQAWIALNKLVAEGNLKAIQILLDRKYGQAVSFSVQDVAVQNIETPNIIFKSTEQMELEHKLKNLNNE